MKKQIRVGFDLDGVLLYNPVRIIRPIMVFVKKYILKRDLNKFYYPKNKFEKSVWWFLHKSSLWPAPGIQSLKKLIKEKKIKAYIISARYESLESDFKKWTKIIDPKKQFSGYFFNDKNEQPQLFKEKMIKKLELNCFVEDNWDIVKHLNLRFQNKNSKLKIFWIYNILDKKIKFKYKFNSLKAVILSLSKDL